MEIEIEFFHKNFTKKDPKSLTDHIQRMALGEAPFFPAMLGLVYGKLFRKTLAPPVVSESSFRTPAKAEPTPFPAPPSTTFRGELLKCPQCSARVRLKDLYDSFRCPHCLPRSVFHLQPFVQCPLCDTLQVNDSDSCLKRSCGVKFM